MTLRVHERLGRHRRRRDRALEGLPPGPPLPRILQGLCFFRHPLELFAECARRYGECFTLNLPSFPGPIVFVSRPEVVRAVFSGDATGAVSSGSVFGDTLGRIVGRHSLLAISGPQHQRHRRLLMPAFRREEIARVGDAIRETAVAAIAGWPVQRPFPLRPHLQGITLDVILRILLGASQLQPDVPTALLQTFLRLGGNPVLLSPWAQVDLGRLSPWGRFLRVREQVYGALATATDRRRRSPRDDLLSAMIEAKDESGRPLADEEIRDELLTFIVAGNETTASALTWAVLHLVRHPAVLRRLLAEVDTLGPDRSAADVAALPYLDATVKEVLRISPIFPFTLRRVVTPLHVGGYELPPDVLIAPSMYLAQRRGDVWSRPEEFAPERFLHGHPASHEFFPFGGGTRHCLGATLATFEMKLVLAEVFRAVEVSLASKTRPTWLANVLVPSGGLPVVVTKRGGRLPLVAWRQRLASDRRQTQPPSRPSRCGDSGCTPGGASRHRRRARGRAAGSAARASSCCSRGSRGGRPSAACRRTHTRRPLRATASTPWWCSGSGAPRWARTRSTRLWATAAGCADRLGFRRSRCAARCSWPRWTCSARSGPS